MFISSYNKYDTKFNHFKSSRNTPICKIFNVLYWLPCAFRVFTRDTSRPLREIFDSIKPLNFLKKMFLIIVGMFTPKYV